MAKEEKPLEYERRVNDTKGLAQRIHLDYLKRPQRFRDLRRRITIWAPVVATVAAIPLLIGVGRTPLVFSNGPVSRAHSLFEQECSRCHTTAFSSVSDVACKACHDGPAHPAKAVDTAVIRTEPACAQCHTEHRGRQRLTDVADRNCTACHASLAGQATGVTIAATRITAFRPERHPEFSAAGKPDKRPLRLNHAVHMPAQPKTIRGMKLPMKCSDCHATDPAAPAGALLPVTFEQHCRSCHKRELEFDVYELLGSESMPAPHTKDAPAIHSFVVASFEKLLAADPSIAQRPLRGEFDPQPNQAAWLAKVVSQSEGYLFDRKCKYCHDYAGLQGSYPIVAKVNRIVGRYTEDQPDGVPWLERGEFSHRAHRAVECASCHTAATASAKTTDVLIPNMQACQPCHGGGPAALGRCAQCHLYHNKSKERDRDRRPLDELLR